MKTTTINFLIALVVAALGIAGAYLQRGYWAFGIEYVLPVIVLAVLLYMEGEENEQRN